MKLVTFIHESNTSYGVLEGANTFNLSQCAGALQKDGEHCPFIEGNKFPPDLLSLIDLEENGVKAAAWVLSKIKEKGINSSVDAKAKQYGVFPSDTVKLLSPIPRPRKVFCVAENYKEHIEESEREDLKHKEMGIPRIFIKPTSNTVIGPEDPILISKNATSIDWEAELAVVIGKRGKYIPAGKALEYVAGYTIFNDVSERDLTIENRTVATERDKFFAWLNGKWVDSFAPTGPYLVTSDEIGDPQNLNIALWVNGQQKQNSNTRYMIDSVVTLIEYLSKVVTLEPGDIIATGTPSGVGFPKGEKLKNGDVVEIEIEKIGRLTNPVKDEVA